MFLSLLVLFAFSAVGRHQALNQSVPIIGVFLLSTALLLGRSLARSFRSPATSLQGPPALLQHARLPLRLVTQRPATSAIGRSSPRTLQYQVTPVLGRSSSRLLQSSVALARTSGNFLRLAVPALSHRSILHMRHTFIHTWSHMSSRSFKLARAPLLLSQMSDVLVAGSSCTRELPNNDHSHHCFLPLVS